jgi:hypothetical protein
MYTAHLISSRPAPFAERNSLTVQQCPRTQPGNGRSTLETPAALGTVCPMTDGSPPLVVTYRLHLSLAIRPKRKAVGPTTELFVELKVPVMTCFSPVELTLVMTPNGPATKALPKSSTTRSSHVTFEARRVGSTPAGMWPHSSISTFHSVLVPVTVQYTDLYKLVLPVHVLAHQCGTHPLYSLIPLIPVDAGPDPAPFVALLFNATVTSPHRTSTLQIRPRKESATRRWSDPGRAKTAPLGSCASVKLATRWTDGWRLRVPFGKT